MKSLRLLFSGLFLALLISAPVVAFASNITSALYGGTIVISNNSTAASNVATVMTLSTADLISQGYTDATLSNVAIQSNGSDVPFMPSYGANPWVIWATSVAANSQNANTLFTGGTSMSSTKYFFPGSAGMTVPDNASIELGSNSTVSVSGYVDTTAGQGKVLAGKPKAYAIFNSQNISGNISAGLSSVAVASQVTADSNIALGAAYNTRAGERFIVFDHPGLLSSVEYDMDKVGNPTGNMTVQVRDSVSDAILATLGYIDVSGMLASPSHSFIPLGIAPYYLASGQDVRILVEYSGGDAGNYIELKYKSAASTYPNLDLTYYSGGYTDQTYDAAFYVNNFIKVISTNGITSGEQTISLNSDSINAWLTDGSTSSANTTVVAIPDTSYPTIFALGNSMLYVDTMSINVGGTLKGLWSWQYATTFTDQSGNGNTATPSFRTTSSSANVTANMTAFAPISTANAPAFAVASPSSFYPSTTTTSGSFTTGNVSGAGFPGSGLVDAGAAAAGIPNIWLWGILGGFTMVMGGLLISIMVRFGGAGNGELFLRMGLGVTVIGIMVALGKYDMWMIIFYLFIAGAFAMASRQYDIGASVSEFNFIGFLSQSWVGLVGINRILEGSFMTSSDSSQWNTLMFTQQYTIGDTFTLPIMNFSFWTEGLPNMVKWNYTFFGGNAQMIQYLLYSLTAILAFIIFGLIIGTLSRTFTR